MSDQLSFSGAIATIPLIGRDGELAQIYAAIAPIPQRAFRCVLIKANGGIGKTRLLNEIHRLLKHNNDISGSLGVDRPHWDTTNIIPLPLIDVADTTLHTRIPFLRIARSRFAEVNDPNIDRLFAEFDQVVAAFDQAHGTYTPYTDQQRLIARIVETFDDAYRKITRTQRVVWMIDTLEQLYFLPPEIDRLFLDATITDYDRNATFGWLVNHFIAELPENTTVILAGRPKPKLWSEHITSFVRLQAQLRDTSTPVQKPQKLVDPAELAERPEETRQTLATAPLTPQDQVVTEIELDEFQPEETVQYLEILQRQLALDPIYRRISSYLLDLLRNRAQCAVLHHLTGGNPIRLAIYLDLLVSGDATPSAFRKDLVTLKDPARANENNDDQLAPVREDINASLIRYLTRNLRKPAYKVFEYLALMQRGLDLERLLYMWGGEREQVIEILNHLLRLSFVKHRPAPGSPANTAEWPTYREGDRLFLHDALYQSFQQASAHEILGSLEDTRQYQREVFERLVAFCRERAEHLSDRIDELTRAQIELQQHEDGERSNQFQQNKHELREALAERRRLRAELLHYSFYFDPYSGFFDVYYDLSDQAFYANDTDLDAQLQSEVEFFFFGIDPELNRELSSMSAIEWNTLRLAVIYERVAGWIRRLTWLGNFREAQLFAEQALEDHTNQARPGYPWIDEVLATNLGNVLKDMYRNEWIANRCFATIFLGERTQDAINELIEIVATIEQANVANIPRYLEERRLDLLGRCLLFAGYGYATLKHFDKATYFYERADAALNQLPLTKLRALKAEVKNDWSRALGELHQLAAAEIKCQEGLDIRSKLGFDYLLGLSYNTMALIYAVNDEPRKSLVWSKQSLDLFRQISRPRGIGLALTQAAKAIRLAWEKQDRVDVELETAEAHLLEAEKIFDSENGDVPEKVRELEVKLELGNLYTTWANLPGVDVEQKRQRAHDILQAAQRIAEKGNYSVHLEIIKAALQQLDK